MRHRLLINQRLTRLLHNFVDSLIETPELNDLFLRGLNDLDSPTAHTRNRRDHTPMMPMREAR
jgi:hypothetical protein